MFLLLISFIAGALTALAPCTISLLPVIVGGSLSGERSIRRAVVVTVSLGMSVIVFTLALKVSTAFVHVPQEFWQYLSGAIIVFLGLAMIFPVLWDKIPGLGNINRESNKLLATGYKKQNFLGDILVGAALGPVFSSCSPTYFLILATVLPRSLAAGIVYLIAYALGLGIILFVITLAGQRLLEKLGVASDPRGTLKRSIGAFFLIVGVAIFLGYDKKLETAITNAGFFDETKIEQFLLGGNSATMLSPQGVAQQGDESVSSDPMVRAAMKSLKYPRAAEISNPSGFVNTDGQPITIGQFKGEKVVLIDFWTYSCINCQRTLPYMRAWYDKYHDQGLEIIGIHTPEFAFEHVLSNVQKAVNGFELKYPTVLDNDYGTWNAFGNQYWPRKYLIDIDGFVVYDHAGEGKYDETERAIQWALEERTKVLGMKDEAVSGGIVAPSDVVTVDSGGLGSPETYFGASRNEYLGNGRKFSATTQLFTLPSSVYPNTLYLGGTWTISDEYAHAQSAGSIVYKYKARDVYFVASSQKGSKLTLLLDGKPIAASGGKDVSADGTVMVSDNRLYHLVHTAEYGQHTLEIKVDGAGLDAYTFTFG